MREVSFRLLSVLHGHVEAHVVEAMDFHFMVDGPRHDVAWSQRLARIVLLHELAAVGQFEDSPVAAHGLGDEEGGMGLGGIVKNCGVELHKLHVLHGGLGAVGHGNAVAGGNLGIGGGGVDGSCAAGGHQRDARKVGVNLIVAGINHVGSIALNVGRAARHFDSKVVLGDDFHGKVVLQHLYPRVAAHGVHEAALYLEARVVLMVEDAELRVTALTVQVERSVALLVEVDAPLHQVADCGGRVSHHMLNGLGVGKPVAGHHGVMDMLLKVVHLDVGHRGDAALRLGGVGLVKSCLANDGHASFA